MCNFINSIPQNSVIGENSTPKFLDIYPRETAQGEFYRFRLIGFTTKTRDYPFIEKYVHEIRERGEDGKNHLVDSVVCKNTKYARILSGEPTVKCPICQFVDKQWVAWKESGYKDKISNQKKNKFQKRYRAHILVYVVNDPNYDGNNGKLRVLTFYDRDEYKKFQDLAKKTLRKSSIFNGGDAVDFWLKVGKERVVYYEGTENEREVTFDKITDMGFSTKPYPIPNITSELVDSFPFDEVYYNYSTDEEILRFYKKYCMKPAVNVPDDDIVPSTTETQTAQEKIKETKSNIVTELPKEVKPAIDEIEINSLLEDDEDINDIPEFNDKTDADDINMKDIDDLLNGLDDIN